MEEKRSVTIGSMPVAGVLVPILLSMAVGFAAPARGETVLIDDLKKAAEARGCQSIPYPSLRGECNSLQDAIERCKEERDGDPAKELATKTRAFDEIARKQQTISDIERKKKAKEKELKSKPASLAVLIQDMDQEIAKLSKEIAAQTTDQQRHEAALDIEKRVDNGKHCAQYRAGLRAHFDDVIKMLNEKKSFSADAKANKHATKYAREIVEHIEAEARGHKIQEDAWNNRVAAWQKVMNL